MGEQEKLSRWPKKKNNPFDMFLQEMLPFRVILSHSSTTGQRNVHFQSDAQTCFFFFFFSCFAFPSITGQSETVPVVVAAGTLRRAYQQFGFPKAVGILNHVTISLSHISLKVAGIVNVWNCWNVKLKRVTHIQYFNTKMVNVTYIKMPKCNLFYVYLFCWGWRG